MQCLLNSVTESFWMLTLILHAYVEQLRRKDEAIRLALAEKQQLVADILHVPREEFENIAELAGEPSVDKEATELVLAAINQGTGTAR
jgi:hypothetical protein